MLTWIKMAGIAALLFFGVTAASAGKQDFDLVNATGYTIAEVYVAPSSSNNWEEDVLGRDFLRNRERVTINFAPNQKACLYDILVVWNDGDQASWDSFNLCTLSEITLYWENGRAWADYQ
jgi:hypothetical protein